MKARLGILGVLFVWLVVMLTPTLRETWLVQITGRSPLYPGWGYVPFYNATRSGQPPVQKLETEFPGEPKALAVALFLRSMENLSQPDTLPRACDELDRVIARFPDQPWLMAARLRWTLQWMQHNRLAGELSDPDLIRRRARGLPSPEKVNAAPNFTLQELNSALAVARRGAQLEPDNALWDWMAAQLNIYSWRDGAAWNALEAGAAKRLYDTHEREWQEALVWAYQAMLGRALLVEEKDYLRRGSVPNLQGGRGIGRLVTWQAVKAERRGDHQTALRIINSFCQVQALRARQCYTQRESALATMLAVFPLGRARLWSATAPGAAWNLEKEARWRSKELLRYAAAHGRVEDGRRVTASVIALAHAQEQSLYQAVMEVHDREGSRSWLHALGTYGAMNALWQQAAMCGALWLALGGMLHFLGLPRVTMARSDGAFGVALVTAIVVALAAGVASQTSGLGANIFGLPLPNRAEQFGLYDAASVLLPVSTAVPALFITVLVQGLTLWRLSSSEPAPSWRERWGQARPAPLVIATALGLGTLTMLIWWQFALTGPDMGIVVPRQLAGLPLGPLGGHAVGFAAVHPNVPLGAMLLGLVAGWLRWVFAAAPNRRAVVLYRLSWLRQLLGAAVVLCSVLYVAAGFSALSPRRVAEGEWRKALAQGDNPLRQN